MTMNWVAKVAVVLICCLETASAGPVVLCRNKVFTASPGWFEHTIVHWVERRLQIAIKFEEGINPESPIYPFFPWPWDGKIGIHDNPGDLLFLNDVEMGERSDWSPAVDSVKERRAAVFQFDTGCTITFVEAPMQVRDLRR